MKKQHGSIDPLHGLKEVHLDFEKQLFTVNGVDIGKCTDVDIMFHNGEWTVNLCERATLGTKGEYLQKKSLPL